ncbi:MAG TPA: CDP-alcohol phosphatidyltransferase family protein [Candidatus Fraserbacteria bacterium]|nr:CDP-alcohol phosphatidyltransferase family protein [Candidatus Fraserbacteria bacterium]
MTPANAITLVRLGLIPWLIAELLLSRREMALGLLVAILAGDLADGALARWRREITPLGKVLDPLVDKLLFTSLLTSLAWQGRLPWVALGLLVFQQLGLLWGALLFRANRCKIPAARPLGKGASLALGLSLILLLGGQRLSSWGLGLLYLGIALSYLAGLDYALQLRRRLLGRSY